MISRTVQEEGAYKNPDAMANVQAMKKMTAMGYEFTPGMKVSYVVVDSRAKPQRVEPYIDGRPFDHQPDWRYYAGRLAMSLSRITEVFGWEEGSLLTGSRQKSLFDGGFGNPDGDDGDDDDDDEDDSVVEEAPPDLSDEGEWGHDDIAGDAGLTKREARITEKGKKKDKEDVKESLDFFM